jgi:hypothetical protein
MKRMKIAIAASAVVLTLWGPAHGATTKHRGVDELQLMNEEELLFEATNACTDSALYRQFSKDAQAKGLLNYAYKNIAIANDAFAYLRRIGLVIRSKLGKEPIWWDAMIAASDGQGSCLDIFAKHGSKKVKK